MSVSSLAWTGLSNVAFCNLGSLATPRPHSKEAFRCWMVPDLHLLPEAVVPAQPPVAEPHTVPLEFQGDTDWFIVLDLEEISILFPFTQTSNFCFPLTGKTSLKTKEKGQYIWTGSHGAWGGS